MQSWAKHGWHLSLWDMLWPNRKEVNFTYDRTVRITCKLSSETLNSDGIMVLWTGIIMHSDDDSLSTLVAGDYQILIFWGASKKPWVFSTRLCHRTIFSSNPVAMSPTPKFHTLRFEKDMESQGLPERKKKGGNPRNLVNPMPWCHEPTIRGEEETNHPSTWWISECFENTM